MPRRSSMADRIDKGAAGADVFTATEPIAAPEPPAAPRRGRKKIGAGWEASNKAVTFYCPLPVYEALMAASRGDRSKTQIIVDALRSELDIREAGDEP